MHAKNMLEGIKNTQESYFKDEYKFEDEIKI